MQYEPDTLWGRTVRGDRELTHPAIGLSLVQRRLLAKLARPRPFAALAVSLRIEIGKLEQELLRLAELELVAFQRPGAPRPRTAPGRMPRIDLGPATTVTPSRGWRAPLPLYFAAIAVGMGAVLLLAT